MTNKLRLLKDMSPYNVGVFIDACDRLTDDRETHEKINALLPLRPNNMYETLYESTQLWRFNTMEDRRSVMAEMTNPDFWEPGFEQKRKKKTKA